MTESAIKAMREDWERSYGKVLGAIPRAKLRVVIDAAEFVEVGGRGALLLLPALLELCDCVQSSSEGERRKRFGAAERARSALLAFLGVFALAPAPQDAAKEGGAG